MMDDFETDLATALRTAVPAPPTEIDPAEITGTARRPRSRSVAAPVVAALVVAAVALAVLALAHTGKRGPQQAASPPVGQLSTAQRALAVRVAKAEAWAASPLAGSIAPPSGVTGQREWPSTVDQATAIVTTDADAMHYVGAAGGDTTPVLVVRLVGAFNAASNGPPGPGHPTGNVLTIIVNASTGEIIHTGLARQDPPQPLPNAAIIYTRTGDPQQAASSLANSLSSGQRALAVRIAKAEAWGSPPSGTGLPPSRATGQAGWPSNVSQVYAIATTHADAMQYVGTAGSGDNRAVIVVRMVGAFSFDVADAYGMKGHVTGNVMTIVADSATGAVLDTNLRQSTAPTPLPGATILFEH